MRNSAFSFLLLILISNLALADLPTPSTVNRRQSYGQGNGYGAGYYDQQAMNQQMAMEQQRMRMTQSNIGQVGQSSSDLLWLFTGSDASITKQMKSGFRGGGEGTFWSRIWSFTKMSAYKRFLAPAENRLTGILSGYENTALAAGQGVGAAPTSAAPCYDCIQQQNTNPLARNQNAINPAIFNGPTRGTQGSAGGIR